VLLVDDQPIIGEAVRRMLLDEPGLEFHYCQDPTRALETAAAVRPTVILQDLVMPDIDGLTLVKFFRRAPHTADVPLIVLSTKEEAKVKAEAFSLGANDYLVKLPDRVELVARIRHHSQGYCSRLERDAALRQLTAELAEAAQYVRGVLPPPLTAPGVTIDWRFAPSTSLGGDGFGYHWLDEDRLAFFLVDVCGHGVGAALLSVSVMNVLRSRTLPDTDFGDPARVLAALGDSFPMERQGGKFFTAWYGIYERGARRLRYASGGHPPALLLTGAPPMTRPLGTGGLVVGALPDQRYTNDAVTLTEPARLYLFSDGVYEIARPDAPRWSYDELAAFLAAAPPGASPLDRLREHVRTMSGTDTLDDDFSILELQLD
jgi:sigma-B regulation protein RsbU (phosphoserine phosphatase)